MKPRIQIHRGEVISPIQSLTDYFREGGVSIMEAAFAHTYFVPPDEVRKQTPYFPNRVRQSREYFPGLRKGTRTTWSAGDKREIILDDNSQAQRAWQKYTGRKLARGSGYGVRHIWGNTHNPTAFTAGWNICYMPYWAGMLTEDQHPHPELQQAIRQASWDLYFSEDPVCEIPDFVKNPGGDLNKDLGGLSLLVIRRENTAAPDRKTFSTRQGTTLPITLEPPNSAEFLAALLRTKVGWIEETYHDGRKVTHRWDASRMTESSKVLGNLRSRKEYRAGEWQKSGIASVKVSIERSGTTGG